METTILERVKEVRSENKVSQIEFAKILGVSASYIAGLEMGRNSLNQKFLQAVNEKYSISIDWLMFGKKTAPEIDINIIRILMSLDNYNGIIISALNAEIGKIKKSTIPEDIKMLNSDEFINIHSQIMNLGTKKTKVYTSILEDALINGKPKTITDNIKEYSSLNLELYSLIHNMFLELDQLEFIESMFDAKTIKEAIKKMS